jgi:hypothetical protein
LLFAAAILGWVAFRSGWLPHYPAQFAGLVGLLIILCVIEAGILVRDLWTTNDDLVRSVGRLILLCGIALAGSAGLVNWLFSLQGYVILSEGEAVPLGETSHLQEFDAGPLSDLDEMQVMLLLEEVELSPMGGRSFAPTSRLQVEHGNEGLRALEVGQGNVASVGSLRLHQGAFGFAPRIVIIRNDRQIFDRVVPFLTKRIGSTGVSFQGEFSVARENLDVTGVVDLSTLDEKMKGHARLRLAIQEGGKPLGSGHLMPGHFADLASGYRIGFADLTKWSEIDISRRSYPAPILGGLGLTVIGAVTLLVGAIRQRHS